MATDRTNTYAFLLWQESAPSNWREILAGLRLPIAVSPLHDRDTYTEEDAAKNPMVKAGDPKKPHWHVMVFFESLKSARQVLKLLSDLPVSYVEMVVNKRGYCRYLTHLDDPDKAQYDPSEVRFFGAGETYFDTTRELTKVYIRQIRLEIHELIDRYKILEYYDLIRTLEDNGMFDHADWASSHTIHLKALLDSKRNSCRRFGRHLDDSDEDLEKEEV